MTSLRRKIGELFMIGYPGMDPSAARELIERHHIGGIILFTRNIQDAAHARSVCQELHKMRASVDDTPLFIAIDQEGGCVARITEGVTIFPGNMALGATGSEEYARQAGRVTGAELAALGFNIDFAPVLDISSNPRNPGVGARSFGSDPTHVSRLGAAMIRGLQENVCAAAKHFPGLGDARVDSHDELPLVDLPRRRLDEVELAPFRAAIDADVSFVMTAHCSFPALDESVAPATFSPRMLSNLLRKEMKFGGIIITDCLEMGAVEKRYSAPETARKAILAGADMLLICHTREKQLAAIDAIVHAVESGEITEQRIDESLARIRAIKRKIKKAGGDFQPQKELSEEIAARAITLVENKDGFIPLRLQPEQRLVVVTPSFQALTKVEDSGQRSAGFLAEVKKFHPNLTHLEIPIKPEPDAQGKLPPPTTYFGPLPGALVILTYNLHLNPIHKEWVQGLLSFGAPSVVAAVRDPHDLAFIHGAKAYIATYSFRECSLKALAAAIFGKIEMQGELPVRLQ